MVMLQDIGERVKREEEDSIDVWRANASDVWSTVVTLAISFATYTGLGNVSESLRELTFLNGRTTLRAAWYTE